MLRLIGTELRTIATTPKCTEKECRMCKRRAKKKKNICLKMNCFYFAGQYNIGSACVRFIDKINPWQLTNDTTSHSVLFRENVIWQLHTHHHPHLLYLLRSIFAVQNCSFKFWCHSFARPAFALVILNIIKSHKN